MAPESPEAVMFQPWNGLEMIFSILQEALNVRNKGPTGLVGRSGVTPRGILILPRGMVAPDGGWRESDLIGSVGRAAKILGRSSTDQSIVTIWVLERTRETRTWC